MAETLPTPKKAAEAVTVHIPQPKGGTKLETFQVRNVLPTWKRGERPNEAWFEGVREFGDGSKQLVAFPESAMQKGG